MIEQLWNGLSQPESVKDSTSPTMDWHLALGDAVLGAMDQENPPKAGDNRLVYGQMSDDYDYAGFNASGLAQASNGHFPDTFKLPNHMTFSEESKYHGQDGNEGGRWSKLGEDRWSFTPGATNFKHHSLQEMQDYFKQHEPGNVLNATAMKWEDLPPSQVEDRRSELDRSKRIQDWSDSFVSPDERMIQHFTGELPDFSERGTAVDVKEATGTVPNIPGVTDGNYDFNPGTGTAAFSKDSK